MEKLTLILVLMAFGALSFMPAGKVQKKTKSNVAPQTFNSVKKNNDVPDQKKVNDTLPDNKRTAFSTISSNINNDGTTRKAEVTAKTKDGKTYTYRLENDKIVELTVNGEKIKEENFYRYDSIVGQIEEQRKEDYNKMLLDQKRSQEKLLEQNVFLENNLLQLQKKMQEDVANQNDLKLLQEKMFLENKYSQNLAELNNQNENKTLLYEKMAQRDKELQELKDEKFSENYKLLQEFKQKASEQELYNQEQLKFKNELLAAQDEKFHDSNYDLSLIIASLADAGLIADKKDFSFSLNNDELIVDGKKQSANLHESLRKRFIRNKKDYFKYKAKQNSRSTDIYVE